MDVISASSILKLSALAFVLGSAFLFLRRERDVPAAIMLFAVAGLIIVVKQIWWAHG